MKRKIAASIASVAFCLGGLVVAQASASTVANPAIVSLSISPKTVSENGGSITLTVRVRNATTCVFGGVGQVTKSCAKGTTSVTDTVAANSTSTVKKVSLWVYAKGHGRRSPLKTVTLTEAAIATSCTGSCTFTFPAPDVDDVASIAVNSISEDVAWPDPNYPSDLPAGDQLDALNATMCAGPTGISAVWIESGSLTLSVSSGVSAQDDAVTFDSSLGTTSFGNYGAIGPDQCVTGNIYLDAPAGSTWAIVNFIYEATSGNTLTYVWNAS